MRRAKIGAFDWPTTSEPSFFDPDSTTISFDSVTPHALSVFLSPFLVYRPSHPVKGPHNIHLLFHLVPDRFPNPSTNIMAIYSKVSSYVQSTPAREPLNIEAWTEQATRSLSAVSISSPGVRNTSESLGIPLDERPEPKAASTTSKGQNDHRPDRTYCARREPLRRDSMKRRDALLKGKEGSRQRRRWENGW